MSDFMLAKLELFISFTKTRISNHRVHMHWYAGIPACGLRPLLRATARSSS